MCVVREKGREGGEGFRMVSPPLHMGWGRDDSPRPLPLSLMLAHGMVGGTRGKKERGGEGVDSRTITSHSEYGQVLSQKRQMMEQQ